MPRWILPLVLLSDLLVLGVLYAVLGRPGLLFGLPVLIGTAIALLVLRLVTAPHRRLLADLRSVGAGGPAPYRHGSPGGAEEPFWAWPGDRPTSGDGSGDDSCDDRDHRHGVDHSCGGSWTSDPGRDGWEPSWSGPGADSGWSGSDPSAGSSSDSSSSSSSSDFSSSSSSDSGSSSSSSSD
ncbi:hypothetical protein GCM10010472_41920 [Pseudonocardia halophobica]|uniref:Uncharacterized protein n=1 Tax=Pseudonocardia halophobica TaxID=29401 RepID=A0A9W6NXH7_9PSEU|nr:hypothetical protein [Pseudonocardia halophobica]GLL12507.1 hypothetical protein GCM10017577_36480 [Pseudonocardia halophobica]